MVLCVCVAEESDGLTEYEEDGMDTVREEEGEEEEDEVDDPEDHSPGEWGANDIFQSVSSHIYTKEKVVQYYNLNKQFNLNPQNLILMHLNNLVVLIFDFISIFL